MVMQKVISNRFYANALKLLVLLRRKRTHYDLEDAEHLREDPTTLHFFLRKCHTVSVGSQALMEYCSTFNPRVFVTTSPVVEHRERKTERNEKLTVGWVGDFGNGKAITRSFSHKTSMYTLLFPELRKLKRPIKLMIIGVKVESDIDEIQAYFADCPHIELEIPRNLNWKQDLWVYKEIAKFDIGVAPMVDHPFTRSKSAFKSKQYFSVGIPTLASDVGENRNFVQHNENGFLC